MARVWRGVPRAVSLGAGGALRSGRAGPDARDAGAAPLPLCPLTSLSRGGGQENNVDIRTDICILVHIYVRIELFGNSSDSLFGFPDPPSPTVGDTLLLSQKGQKMECKVRKVRRNLAPVHHPPPKPAEPVTRRPTPLPLPRRLGSRSPRIPPPSFLLHIPAPESCCTYLIGRDSSYASPCCLTTFKHPTDLPSRARSLFVRQHARVPKLAL